VLYRSIVRWKVSLRMYGRQMNKHGVQTPGREYESDRPVVIHVYKEHAWGCAGQSTMAESNMHQLKGKSLSATGARPGGFSHCESASMRIISHCACTLWIVAAGDSSYNSDGRRVRLDKAGCGNIAELAGRAK
jgi:hypothetical protein